MKCLRACVYGIVSYACMHMHAYIHVTLYLVFVVCVCSGGGGRLGEASA